MKIQKTDKLLVKKLVPARKQGSFKNDYGHILIIAGSRGMTGAAVLCANACARSGAGLVTLGIPETQEPIAAKKTLPGVMTLPLPQTKEASLSCKALNQILDFIDRRKITNLAIGPGLTTNPSTNKLVIEILNKAHLPVVLDADGLNAVSGSISILKKSASDIAITPHPGELNRLNGASILDIRKNRPAAAMNFSKTNNVICVLKGHKTIISDGIKIYVNSTGNPGMAKGGSGDVLTGMYSAFVFQVIGETTREKLLNAGIVSVYLHGLAGDLAAKNKTQISMTPGDIIDNIPEAVKNTFN